MEARDSFCFPKKTKNPNPSPIGKKFGFSILTAVLPLDIPTGWEPRTNKSPTGAFVAPPAAGPCCSSPLIRCYSEREKDYIKQKRQLSKAVSLVVRIRGLEPPPSCPD